MPSLCVVCDQTLSARLAVLYIKSRPNLLQVSVSSTDPQKTQSWRYTIFLFSHQTLEYQLLIIHFSWRQVIAALVVLVAVAAAQQYPKQPAYPQPAASYPSPAAYPKEQSYVSYLILKIRNSIINYFYLLIAPDALRIRLGC